MRRTTQYSLITCVVVIVATGVMLLFHRPESSTAALYNVDRYELLSLDPDRFHSQPGDDFHGYRVLGRTVVADVAVQLSVSNAIRDGIDPAIGAAACFNPRHGIRVTRAGQTTDFVICFECSQVKGWRGDRQVAYWITNSSPRVTIDGVLLKAGVSLPTQ